ncbi:MAG: hypothetical protein HY984_00345 [Candidatus Magasanikbacteria bacterium]|nr:hypothetical protein [Candidatus Magasanikbacteria bacterium]
MLFGLTFVHWLVIISVGVSISGALMYVRDTYRGKTKPNRVSWSMWALAPLIGFFAALSADADIWTTVRIFLAGFLPLLVLSASFVNPQSYWRLTAFDAVCGFFSALALIVWAGIHSPSSAILLAAAGDGLATLPTIRKAWKNPETETGITYIASFVSVALVLPSIPKWNIQNSAFQIQLLIANALLIFSVYRKHLGVW